MPMRLIQNSFISGEIAPELYGRHDIKAYFQGAAKIRNFVVRKTGGIRKRAGTELVAMVDAGVPAHFRVIPFLFDRTNYACLVLYKKHGVTSLFYRLLKRDRSRTVTMSDEAFTTVTSVANDADLDQLNFKQLGDTIYFTAAGRRSFKAEVFYDGSRVEWSQLSNTVEVRKAPAMSARTTGFRPASDAYVASTVKYALFGVKDGVISKPTEREVSITLAWISGAKVTLQFTPRWDWHDYYILGKLQGANYGSMASFYPDFNAGSPADATFANSNTSETGTVDGEGWTAATTAISTEWKKSPNLENAPAGSTTYHMTSTFVTGNLGVTYRNSTSPIIALKIWFGAKVRKTSELPDVTTVQAVGVSGVTTVKLMRTPLTGDPVEVASWDVSATYGDAEQHLVVDTPQLPETATYTVSIVNENGTPVLVRGIVLVTDDSTQTFVDNNIAVTDITGIQEKLTVGDTGMDCDLCDIWEQRMVMAASTALPFSLWFSSVGNIYNFYSLRPQTMADAFSVSIPPTTASRILHMVSGRWLTLFTEAGEYMCSGSQDGFGYATVQIKRTSSVGAHEDIKPVSTENQLLFVAADGRSVYEMRYDLSQDNVVPIDRSLVASHMTERADIVKTAFQRFPDSALWCLLSDGTAISMTFLPEQEVVAWARHDFGDTNMRVVDIFCPGSIASSEGLETTSEAIVVLTCDDDPSKVWIERMRQHVVEDVPATSLARCADHLAYSAEQYPNGINPQTGVVAELVTLRPESPDFNSMALRKTILDTAVRVRRSGAVKVKPLRGDLAEAVCEAAVVEDSTVSLHTGDRKVLPRSFYNDDGQMVFASADEWPCEIQCLLCNLEIGQEGM